jgi:arginase family enzyme
MGRGPGHLVRNGVRETLQNGGHEIRAEETVEATSPFRAEISTAFELHALISGRVRHATEEERFSLILSGNCNASLGTISALGSEETGIIWFGAHAEFNTPETTTSGYLDGMGLAVAVGDRWKAMAQTVPGFRPVPEANVILVGIRDTDEAEEEQIRESSVILADADLVRTPCVRGTLAPPSMRSAPASGRSTSTSIRTCSIPTGLPRPMGLPHLTVCGQKRSKSVSGRSVSASFSVPPGSPPTTRRTTARI